MSSRSKLPPTVDRLEAHGLLPTVDHDDAARFNFITNLSVFLNVTLSPGVRTSFEKRVRPAMKDAPTTSADIRDAMLDDPFYQAWGALRRNTQEMAQATARGTALKDIARLNVTAASLNAGKNTLALNPETEIPPGLAQVDNHLLAGSYYTEVVADDVTQAATYDLSLFPVAMGSLGAKGDAGGRAAVKWLKARHSDFAPKRILDLGAGIGGNTLPLAEAFPDAEIVAYDVAAPMVRYGHARAQSMGFGHVQFIQGRAEDLDPSVHGHFDWVHSTMFWHETSADVLQDGLVRIHAVLNAGGLTTHIEQPNFTPETALFDQFLANWDAWYNNEPFWTKLHTMDMPALLAKAGFDQAKIFDSGTEADIEPGKYQSWSRLAERHRHETRVPTIGGRSYAGERWYVFGAWK